MIEFDAAWRERWQRQRVSKRPHPWFLQPGRQPYPLGSAEAYCRYFDSGQAWSSERWARPARARDWSSAGPLGPLDSDLRVRQIVGKWRPVPIAEQAWLRTARARAA